MGTISKLSDSIVDKISIEFLRNQVLKNAYVNDDTFIAKLDPRILLCWYLFFGLVPWFLQNVVLLICLFVFVVITTNAARIAPLVLFLFGVGVFSQSGYLLLVSLFFGGDITTMLPLLILTLKVAVVSLASITVFSGLDPDRLACGLLWFGCPDQLSFSISFAYRILPMLMEEFQNILLSFKFRGRAPAKKGFLGKIYYFIYEVKIVMMSFYPLMLNMAKRSRTTVEALELKGYRYALKNPAVRKMKLSMLKTGQKDYIFILVSVIWVGISVLAGNLISG